MKSRLLLLLCCAATLGACAVKPPVESVPVGKSAPAEKAERVAKPTVPSSSSSSGGSSGSSGGVSSGDGGYYLDDGPPDERVAALNAPDAVVRWEPISPRHNRPYTALGNDYIPYSKLTPYRQRGIASWYGKRYHGNATSSGEIYDMFKMTAAHPILPIPSYVRVTRVATGEEVIVRVNDRGPFLRERLIDLSYAAALRLDIVEDGTGEVIVEAILPPPPAGTETAAEASQAPKVDKSSSVPVYIQVGAYSGRAIAEQALEELQVRLPQRFSAVFSINDYPAENKFTVQIGPYTEYAKAKEDSAMLCREYETCGFIKAAE